MFAPEINILIVDDMMAMRKMVKKALTGIGFSNIIEAADGAEAFEKLATAGNIDLVVSDWNMPNCSGLDFLKKVRADGNLQKTPFVLLTAEAETAQVTEALRAGVDNYIVKPFSEDILKTKLAQTYVKVKKRIEAA